TSLTSRCRKQIGSTSRGCMARSTGTPIFRRSTARNGQRHWWRTTPRQRSGRSGTVLSSSTAIPRKVPRPMTVREIASGLRFPEGPIAMADGSVILVEIARGTLTRVWGQGKTEVIATLGDGPNGAALGPDGAVYVTNNGGFEWHDMGGLLFPGDR